MRATLRGIRELDFVSNGETIQGNQLFLTHPEDGVIGEIAEKIFVRKGFSLPAELAPGKVVDIYCDTRGRLEHIQIVSTSK